MGNRLEAVRSGGGGEGGSPGKLWGVSSPARSHGGGSPSKEAKGARARPPGLASPAGDLARRPSRSASLTVPVSPPPLSPAPSPLPSPAVSSASEASSAASSFAGDESFFESIQEGWRARRREQRRKRLNAVGMCGRPCYLRLSTLELHGLEARPPPPPQGDGSGGRLAAIRIQLVEATADGQASVVWERHTPDMRTGAGVLQLPASQREPLLLPCVTSRQCLVLSVIVDEEHLWAQARYRLQDVRSTVQRTRLHLRSSSTASKEEDGASPSRSPARQRTPTRRHQQHQHSPAQQQSEPGCTIGGSLEFGTHDSSACVWMHARSSLDSALQWRLVVLANELAIFRDANDESPALYSLEAIEGVQEGDFCLPPDAPVAQRSLLVKVRDKEEQHVQWTLVPPTDREFLHWHQLLQKKIYEAEFGLPGASPSAGSPPAAGRE